MILIRLTRRRGLSVQAEKAHISLCRQAAYLIQLVIFLQQKCLSVRLSLLESIYLSTEICAPFCLVLLKCLHSSTSVCFDLVFGRSSRARSRPTSWQQHNLNVSFLSLFPSILTVCPLVAWKSRFAENLPVVLHCPVLLFLLLLLLFLAFSLTFCVFWSDLAFFQVKLGVMCRQYFITHQQLVYDLDDTKPAQLMQSLTYSLSIALHYCNAAAE